VTPVADAIRRSLSLWSGRFGARLRDRRFWVIQALVIGISVVHTGLEAAHTLGKAPDLYLVPVSTYFIPVVYAGLNFGLEGAVPTAVWCCLLVFPNVVLFHHGWERLGVMVQLALLVAIAIVIARRVEQETGAKQRAEVASSRLAELNSIAAATSRSLNLGQVLNETLAAILAKGDLGAAWIAYRPNPAERSQLVTLAGRPPAKAELSPGREQATLRVLGSGTAVFESGAAVVPVMASDKVVGALGVQADSSALSVDDKALLRAIAQHLGVALDNIHNYREARSTLTRLAQTQEALQSYLQMATMAQEEERRRLARELHDDTIQTLVIATASLETIAAEGSLADKTRGRLSEVKLTLTTAIDNVRRFSRDLRPSLIDDLGLLDALDWLVNDTRSRSGIEVSLATSGRTRRIEPRAELGVYRIVQEALRNVERHSGAKRAQVRLSFAPASLKVSVADDGSGFDATTLISGDTVHLGLRGMHERAKLAGGDLSVTSAPGKGTRIELRLRRNGTALWLDEKGGEPAASAAPRANPRTWK
jgi:signal transduction histidine kinase